MQEPPPGLVAAQSLAVAALWLLVPVERQEALQQGVGRAAGLEPEPVSQVAWAAAAAAAAAA